MNANCNADMAGRERRSRAHQLRIFLLIASLAGSLYLLTYRARIQSGDTLRAFDAMTSLSRYGDWLLDESAASAPPLNLRDWHALPLAIYDVEENLHIRLALPLLKLAERVPQLGNLHTVWLFNIIATALTIGLMYLTLRALEYGDGVAVSVALGAAVASNVYAYSQTFFRETPVALFLLLSLYLIQATRKSSLVVRLAGVIAGLGALYLAFATKSSAIVALPAVCVFALPQIHRLETPRLRGLSSLALGALCLFLALIMLIEPVGDALGNILKRPGSTAHSLSQALRMYLLSPGGSIWASSPPLLLAIAGALIMLRQSQLRLPWMAFTLCSAYALGHALFTGDHWFGGLSFPPRFLTPVIPALALCAAPIAEKALRGPRSKLALLCLALIAYGAWIQFSAVSLSFRHYGESLPPESDALAEWEPGLTQPRYFRWFVTPSRWADLGFDFLWTRSKVPLRALSFAALALAQYALLLRLATLPSTRWRHLAAIASLLLIPLTLMNLRGVYYSDPATRAGNLAMHAALDTVARGAKANDILLLPHDLYAEALLNHYDAATPRPIVLKRALAEAASEKQPAQLVSDNPYDWFEIATYRALHHVASHRDRLFLLANTDAFSTWSYRPTERYLALHHYPMGETVFSAGDDRLRLLEISTRHAAPEPTTLFFGEHETDLAFGEDIHLHAYSLPGGENYRPGEALELSLLWRTQAPIAFDYTLAWFVAAVDAGQPRVQGHDSAPQAGFANTSTWRVGRPVWDNRALRLPEDMEAGEYRIWLALYRYDAALGGIQRLPVNGAEVLGDGTIGLLPPIIRIALGEPAAGID